MVYIDIPEELYLRNKLAFGADSIIKKNGMFYINDGSVKVKVVDTFLNTEEIMSIEQSRIEKRRDLDKQGKYGIFNFFMFKLYFCFICLILLLKVAILKEKFKFAMTKYLCFSIQMCQFI